MYYINIKKGMQTDVTYSTQATHFILLTYSRITIFQQELCKSEHNIPQICSRKMHQI